MVAVFLAIALTSLVIQVAQISHPIDQQQYVNQKENSVQKDDQK